MSVKFSRHHDSTECTNASTPRPYHQPSPQGDRIIMPVESAFVLQVEDVPPSLKSPSSGSGLSAWLLFTAVVIITLASVPHEISPTGEVGISHVFFYSWLTAVSTGFGALPFVFIEREPSPVLIGACAAVAGGMMLSASFGLIFEGMFPDSSKTPAPFVALCGAGLGWVFILITKSVLDQQDDHPWLALKSTDTVSSKKIVLVVFVMFIHSFSEGVGIGVSFSGARKLGLFVSGSLAIHNVPEGLAVACVLRPRGFTLLETVRIYFPSSTIYFLIKFSAASFYGACSHHCLSRLLVFPVSSSWRPSRPCFRLAWALLPALWPM